MSDVKRLKNLFLEDVTRDIPPVVYLDEQSPEKVADEVRGYIVTGGWPEGHPNRNRVPDGIHEQYVRLLTNIAAELGGKDGVDLPNVWISGFYGSGKSSFAKLLGLALDGMELPDGRSVAAAWLARDTSPRSAELRTAWDGLRQAIDPLSVVFDVGSVARDGEHIHAVAIRQVQKRLGYCATDPSVADYELKLERDGEWERFLQVAEQTLGKPWDEAKSSAMAEEAFSEVMHAFKPERYTDPLSWFEGHAGTHSRNESPTESAAAIRDMLEFRRPGTTLFLVIDEVSQFVLASKDRVDRLRAFATALGSKLRGRVWLLALGQQKLEEEADDSFLVWAKDRFPPKLRVHLAPTNIRDVVHKRILQKDPAVDGVLRDLFSRHRADLKLLAYGCADATPEEFVEAYPLLPGHMDLILQLTSALRNRSTRAQGDAHAIRGLLQLLGDLFREHDLADAPVGTLVTLDRIYDVLHTALDADVQASMARVLEQRAHHKDDLAVRVAKTVALLELIQDTHSTGTELIARCLFDRVDLGDNRPMVQAALDELRDAGLLGYSEKLGYKIQSTAGEEWERERREHGVPRERIGDLVRDALERLTSEPERPRLQGRPFPWAAVISDGRALADAKVVDPRDAASVKVDFRFLPQGDRTESTWRRKSGESTFEHRLLWVAGDASRVEDAARDLERSRAMIRRYKPRRGSLSPAHKMLFQEEENRAEELEGALRKAVAEAWMNGRLYFKGRAIEPREHGSTFAAALLSAGNRVLPELFPNFDATQLQPSEVLQLLDDPIRQPSPKLLTSNGIGVLALDNGRYDPVCSGVVPRRVLEQVEAEGGLAGSTLLQQFQAPPFGYTTGVVKACVAGLLRGGRIKIRPDGGPEITAARDAGVREVFEKDRPFARATIFPAGKDDIGRSARAKICDFFANRLGRDLNREDDAIANAVSEIFPVLNDQLRTVQSRLDRLPGARRDPPSFEKLNRVLEEGLKLCRQTKPTVVHVKRSLDVLNDAVPFVQAYHAELSDDAIERVRLAGEVVSCHVQQLEELGRLPTQLEAPLAEIRRQLDADAPWRGADSLSDAIAEIRETYRSQRGRLLERQGYAVEEAKRSIRTRNGFSTLTADQAHHVLRPIASAATDTDEDAIAPSLLALRDQFEARLRRAELSANDELDRVLSEGDESLIQPVTLDLRNREIVTEEDVEQLTAEIRDQLLEHVRNGVRVRLT